MSIRSSNSSRQLCANMQAMSDVKTQALRRVPLFAHCSNRELEFVASRTDEVDVPEGRALVRQGQPGDTFYVLLEGSADVEVDGAGRPALGPGDFFGEISMLDRGPATATVVTTAPCRLMVMSHSQFRDAVKGSEDLLGQVMVAMGERLRADSLARRSA
jgi:CRP/FNR family transcriptional regulator, cyclic AMP receptor protein